MKKCPYCKADIEDDARFCLYCMTSLDEKEKIPEPKYKNKRRWLAIPAALLALILIGGGFGFIVSRKAPADMVGENSPGSGIISADAPPVTSFSAQADAGGGDAGSSADNAAGGSSRPSAGSAETHSSQTPSSGVPASAATSGGTSSGAVPQSTVTSAAGSATDAPVSSAAPSSSANAVAYIYRPARQGDDYLSWLSIGENDIVITGVGTASENGRYVIPETIDGKTVIAIMGGAFNDGQISDTVKEVVVPASVKTIWDSAFSACYNLTDIYFCGNAIYTSYLAFPPAYRRSGTLTIHCSADCTDRNFRYYKNCADGSYDALYEEWNG